MSEFYIKNKKLIQESEWKKNILELKLNATKVIKNKKDAKIIMKKELLRAITERIPEKKAISVGKERFGILFSGGVDSSLIALVCKQQKANFTCYCVGFHDKGQKYPEDVAYAKKVAKKLDIQLKIVLLDFKKAEKIIKKTVKILGKELNNVVNVGVAGVIVAAMDAAEEERKQDGGKDCRKIKTWFSGLGSEEIFAGYERHIQHDKKDYKHVQEECWNGLTEMYNRDFLRDFAVAKHFRTNILTPFIDLDLIRKSMCVSSKFKINKKYKKIILREVSEDIGLSHSFSWRKKVAAQYGSRLDKAIQKLARKAGFRYKIDYLKSLE